MVVFKPRQSTARAPLPSLEYLAHAEIDGMSQDHLRSLKVSTLRPSILIAEMQGSATALANLFDSFPSVFGYCMSSFSLQHSMAERSAQIGR